MSAGVATRGADAPAPPGPGRPRGGRWRVAAYRALPWFLAGVAWLAALALAGTPETAVARFGAYWLLAVTAPGTLIYRTLRGSRGSWPEDLAYGAVVGLVCEAAVWAGAAAVGHPLPLRAWPVAVLLAFAAVPALRRHWRIDAPRALPVGWHWGVAGAAGAAALWAVGQWRAYPLRPTTADYYPDMLYHLSLVRELMRPMPFQLPQLAGEPLSYHFLSHAHMAAASTVAGVEPLTVVFRLWLAPIMVLLVVTTAAVAREVAGRWWAGPVAAGTAVLAVPLGFGGPALVPTNSAMSLASPSLTFLGPPLLLLAALCVDAVRGRRLGRAWVLLPAVGLFCAGAKASGVPLLLVGMAVAGTAAAVLRRRVPWPAVAATGALLAALLAGLPLFVDPAGGGLHPQAFSTLQWVTPYRATLGAGQTSTVPGWLPAGLAGAPAAGWLLALSVVGAFLVLHLPVLAGVLLPARRRPRRDPAAWLLAGAVAAGLGVMWTMFHAGGSQLYFQRSAIPLGAVLAAWLLVEVWPGRWAVPVVAATGAAGAACA
ncbi:MAG TPA: hypothetical protein VES42_07670, partial [Pilimelia sp.]|nr:hypothetical protein [Pilimelia sp.]